MSPISLMNAFISRLAFIFSQMICISTNIYVICARKLVSVGENGVKFAFAEQVAFLELHLVKLLLTILYIDHDMQIFAIIDLCFDQLVYS